MKIGIIPDNGGVQATGQMIQVTQLFESIGYESVWTLEHVIATVEYDSNYASNDASKDVAAEWPWGLCHHV